MHEIEIIYLNINMLNQTFTNKIGLRVNAIILKNIDYENIEIKGWIRIGTRSSFL